MMTGASLPTPSPVPSPGTSPVRLPIVGGLLRGAQLGDTVFRLICQLAAVLVVAVAGLLLLVLCWQSSLAVSTLGLEFFKSQDWDPVHEKYGALAFIYGTLVTSAIAMLIAVPLGVGSAAYLSEIAGARFRKYVMYAVELLAAIPSVVYGFWGMFVLAPALQDVLLWVGGPNNAGRGILTCSVVLSVMIVPYVTAVSFDVFRAVPSSQRQASLALGATRWQTIWRVLLPYARPGIVAACFIALGRALGETMAAMMLMGAHAQISFSPFGLGDTMASRIASQLPEATSELYRAALMQLGLVLFAVTMIVNVAARLLIWRMTHNPKGFGWWRQLNSWFFNPTAIQTESPSVAAAIIPPSNPQAQRVDQMMTRVLLAGVVTTIGPLFLILGYLFYKGIGSLDWAFFTELPVPQGETGGGMANALIGSFELVGMATLAAVPIGLFASIYLAEYRNGILARTTRFIGELLGGVPSIVIGIFGYSVVVLPMAKFTDREVTFSAWAGSFALAVMMVPIVMRASEEALKLVPRTLRHASMALGANNWQTIVRITVPAALPAIITAIFLAIARIAGETAPLLLTAGDKPLYWASSPNDFTPSIPVFIYRYSSSPYPDWHRKAWAAALVLMVLVMALNFGIRWIAGKRVIQASAAD
jgi:phosphate transport system permease protein